ncbi:MAG TPA: CotH kinase family protein [Polyangia bacterium]
MHTAVDSGRGLGPVSGNNGVTTMWRNRKSLVSGVLGVLAVSLALLPTRLALADCQDPFGKPHEPLDFHLNIKRSDWTALLASSVPATNGEAACDGQYPEFRAEFRCGETGPWMKIAVRKKRGEERGIEAPNKPPLKIDFNEDFMGQVPEAKGQSWPAGRGEFGYRKLTLNTGQGNKPPNRVLMLPNLLSEHVANRLLHKEVPTAPATAIATVTLHFDGQSAGEFHGSYILIEDIDKSALRRRFARADGRLVKSSKAGCPTELQFDDGPPNAAKAAFDGFIAKSPASFAGRWLPEVEKGVELDDLLRQEAIREILVNGDDTLTYAGTANIEGNNWFSFDPREGKRRYMPWDVDLTFGQQQQNCAPTPLKCPATFPISRFCGTMLPLTAPSKIGAATVCNPEVQKRYYQIMCQLTQGSLSAGEIIKIWDEADKAARPGVAREKDLIWRGMDPLSTTIDKSYGSEYVRLRAWIPERIRSVQQQLTAKGVSCAPGCPAGASESCQYLTCPGERRCEDNLWTECRPKPGCTLPGQTASPVSDGGSDAGVTDANGGGPNTDAPSDAGVDPGPRGSGGTSGAGGNSTGSGSGGAGGSAGGAGGTRTGGSGGGASRTGGTTGVPGAPTSGQGGGCVFAPAMPGTTAPLMVPLLGLVALWGRRRLRRR